LCLLTGVTWSAAESIGLSVGEPAVDVGGGVAPAPVDAVEVAEVGADQGPALRRAVVTMKLATWGRPRRRRDGDCPMDVRTPFLRSRLG
jgi:hypothetical protein